MELFFLEEKLIDKINLGNTKKALSIYKELFEKAYTYNLGNGCIIRSIKNYHLLLNQALYQSFCDNIVSKYSIYEKRNEFLLNIEKTNSIEELYNLGKEMVIYYSNTVIKKCICIKNPIVQKALFYIHEHIDEDLSLEKVANEVHISKFYLSSLFTKCTGYTFSNYINKIRIDKSKSILKDTKKSMLEIAIECGFNSQSYFCSTFKKFTGISPTKYRIEIC